MINRIRKSITLKVLLILLISIAFIMILFGMYSFFMNLNRISNELTSIAESTSKRISNTLSTPLWELRYKDINTIMNLEMTNQNILAIVIKEDNQYFKGKIKNDITKNILEGNILNYEDNPKQFQKKLQQYYILETNLITKPDSEKQIIGTVEIYMTNYYLNRELRNTILLITVQILLLSLVILLIIFFTLKRMILNPLISLDTIVKAYSEKDFSLRSEVNSIDEIGHLSKSFNQMAEEIKKSFDKIEKQNKAITEYNETLEEMVEDRTKELNEANFELKRKNKAMLRELQMAQRVQESIIPTEKDFPKRNELSFGSRYMSMESIGGDLYDIIRVGRNGYGFLMADVSGHGVPAALITTMAKVSFNTNSQWGKSPSEVCKAVNRDMYELIGDLEHYLTAYYSIINLETGEFQYTNAGHHPAILIRKRTKTYEKLDTEGLFIGIFDGTVYETKKTSLEEGDKILLFTDGIIEARNEEDEFYEYERLTEFIKLNIALSAGEFVEKLIEEINEFCKTRTPDDDRAILCIEYVSKKSFDKTIEDSLKVETAKLYNEDMVKKESHMLNNFQNIEHIYSRAGAYIKTKNYKEALKLLLELRDYGITTPKVLHSLGIVYYKLGELEKAHDILKQALEKDKNNQQLMNHLSIINKKINK